MKRIIAVLLIMLSLCSCGKTGGDSSDKTYYSATGPYFDGVIVDINENILTVKPDDDYGVSLSADKIEVSVESVDKYKTGDSVRVHYDGKIMETYPARAHGVSEVYLLEEISLALPKYEVCYVNYCDTIDIYFASLNRETMYYSNALHLPIYKFDDLSQLAGFRKSFEDHLAFDQSYDEVPSFDELTAKYDEDFFAENSLIACYVTSGSGSDRYGVKEIYNDGTNFRITVTATYSPEVGTCDMAGWLIFTEVSKEDIKNVTTFDCVM